MPPAIAGSVPADLFSGIAAAPVTFISIYLYLPLPFLPPYRYSL